MDRLTPAARALLHCVERPDAVLQHALSMACAEVDIEHIRLGIAIDAARTENNIASSAPGEEEHVGSAA